MVKRTSLLDYLDPDLVVFLEAKSRNEALQELIAVLKKTQKLSDEQAFYKALLERERVVSTGIGMGVSIPHAKMKSFSDFFLAVGIQKKRGLEWKSLDKMPVRLVFMIGGPEEKKTQYLHLLSQITKVIREEPLRKKLMQLDSSLQVVELFKGALIKSF